ncbi:hypothetical protein [uncultured Propionibacterium sp.]|uniref:hypothetical protein n=1 Tax=uncultured Propionibacterium sp. TaxID=218066 RepID=UPI0029300150|nr:hypothetical protein [uncultured Propionibacterium sp.]
MTTFLIIGGAGVVLLGIALVVGDVLDGVLGSAEGLFDSDVFSTAGLAGLVGGFGFGGAIGLGVSGLTPVGVLTGLLLGIALAYGSTRLTRVLRHQGSSNTVRTDSLVGSEASVITAIPADGYGQVRLSHNGHLVTISACSTTAIGAGERVWISEVLTPTAVGVEPIDALPAAGEGQ